MVVAGKLLVGCVADDFTGATDVANIFARAGLKTTVLIGVPEDDRDTDADVSSALMGSPGLRHALKPANAARHLSLDSQSRSGPKL
ncbi:hypothetical protein AOG23_29060 [Rhizobium acidisoli]|uniref:four-carbon acid sugar kinase family protein n=1 Tax=Rhizobium acidisoli TaxID=1538158 RepID=UPI0006BA3C00|nr:hypothetical protein AOG23_29060 [Rhizobium acidisoli]